MKKIIFSLLTVITLSTIAACGNEIKTSNNVSSPTDKVSTTENPKIEFNIKEFKKVVSNCNDDIMNESILLSNMGNYEHNYWKAQNSVSGNIDSEELVSKTYNWLLEKGNTERKTVEDNYKSIGEQYSNIVATETSDAEADELKSTLKALYTDFDLLYILVTSPSGDLESFSNDFNTYSNSIKSNNNTLSTLTKE